MIMRKHLSQSLTSSEGERERERERAFYREYAQLNTKTHTECTSIQGKFILHTRYMLELDTGEMEPLSN